MVAWGLVMTLMGIVQNYEGLLIARIFLGVTEAGLFPGGLSLTNADIEVITNENQWPIISQCGIVAMKRSSDKHSSSALRP